MERDFIPEAPPWRNAQPGKSAVEVNFDQVFCQLGQWPAARRADNMDHDKKTAAPGDFMNQNPLFTPFTFKSLQLDHRLVMAPMTRSKSPGGILTEDMIHYYRRRAEGGVGLIISEATGINRPGALNDSDVPHFYGDAALAAWAEAVKQVQQAGGAMIPQLWHVGATKGAARDRRPDPGLLESPSGINPSDGKAFGHAMSEADIADTLAAYAQAAADAKAIGCNGIEIHGAHGYLIDQFFWSQSNRRRDGYGGDSLLERSRFAVEMLQAVRRAVGPDFPVILRISEATGLRRPSGGKPRRPGHLAGRPGGCRRRYSPLLPAPLLGAGVCRL